MDFLLGLLQRWLFWVSIALCLIFEGLAGLVASIPTILCFGFPALIVSVCFLAWDSWVLSKDLNTPCRQMEEISEPLQMLTQVLEVNPTRGAILGAICTVTEDPYLDCRVYWRTNPTYGREAVRCAIGGLLA